MLDTIVIGGGIAGLYVALDAPQTLLLEATSRLGGRIFTHQTPRYEIGAGRIDKRHVLLRGLLKRFGLSEINLKPSKTDEDLLALLPLQQPPSARNTTLGDLLREKMSADEVEKMRHAFGYYSEFEVMNAYDASALLREALSGKYFVVKEGLSELIKRMATNVNYKLNHSVKRVSRTENGFDVDGYACKRVVFAIPPKELARFHVLSERDLHAVAPLPLLRIYASYSIPWAEGINAFTTDSWIRHVIPITPKIIMISYTEGRDIEPFRKKRGLKADSVLSKAIHKELRNILPAIHVPDPIQFGAYLWEEGGHAWLPGVNSHLVAPKILNPAKDVYVCGEAFSHKQAWMEGALETAVEVLKKIDASK